MPDSTTFDIERLEDERYQAMLDKDAPTLERLLHPDLVYMHSSGVADSKESYINGLLSGVWDSRSDKTVGPDDRLGGTAGPRLQPVRTRHRRPRYPEKPRQPGTRSLGLQRRKLASCRSAIWRKSEVSVSRPDAWVGTSNHCASAVFRKSKLSPRRPATKEGPALPDSTRPLQMCEAQLDD